MPLPGKPYPLLTVQTDVPLPDGVTESALESLSAFVLAAEGVEGEWPLGIHFVDDRTMQAAHVEFMDIDEPTDIMTFPYGDGDDEDAGPWVPDETDEAGERGGDLMISVDRAGENAADAGWSTGDELFFLVAHGMLHLLGWDDETDQERAAMLERQAALLNGWRGLPGAMR